MAGLALGATARIDFCPADVRLETQQGRQRYVVVATRTDGVTLDVTKSADVAASDGKLVRIENQTVYPLADGQTTLRVDYDGKSATVPVSVKNAGNPRALSFKLDVMPIFMRAGCNTGACHGSARGKDGFHISLFGYDPNGDYEHLTRELGFRRINLAVPAESLLLEKSIGAVPHSGGKRFEPGSEYYNTLLAWLAAGVPSDAGEVPTAEEVELYPHNAVLEGKGAVQQMILRAKYSNGTVRDVTNLAVFLFQ